MPVTTFDGLPDKSPMAGFTGKFVHTERMTIVRWDIAEEARLPEHSHPQEQITTVLSGEFEMVIDGTAHRLGPGAVAVIPSNTVHAGRAITACLAIDVFQPVRDDYR